MSLKNLQKPYIIQMKQLCFIIWIAAICFSPLAKAQETTKKTLSTDDFAAWKVVNNPIISPDGKIVSFEVNPQKGDGILVVKTTDGKKEDKFQRGYNASFSSESDFVVYKIKQPVDSVRTAKKKKLKKEQMPKDSIGIFVFKQRKTYTFANLKQYSLPKENATWIAFLTDQKKPEKNQAPKKISLRIMQRKREIPTIRKANWFCLILN